MTLRVFQIRRRVKLDGAELEEYQRKKQEEDTDDIKRKAHNMLKSVQHTHARTHARILTHKGRIHSFSRKNFKQDINLIDSAELNVL